MQWLRLIKSRQRLMSATSIASWAGVRPLTSSTLSKVGKSCGSALLPTWMSRKIRQRERTPDSTSSPSVPLMSKEIEEMVIQVALAAIQVIARETTAIISELARNRFLKKKSTDVMGAVADANLTLKNHPT